MNNISYKNDTLESALLKLYLNDNKQVLKAIEDLLENGYTKKGILFVLTKESVQDKIYKFKNDSRIYSIFQNEVKKHAYKMGDERWKK